jgi:hypothetical protein
MSRAGQHARRPTWGDRAAGWSVSAAEAMTLNGRPDVALVDLRERTEREAGVIAGSLPPLHERQPMSARAACCTNSPAPPASIIFYCAFSEALGNGGAGGAGRRARIRLPYQGSIDA